MAPARSRKRQNHEKHAANRHNNGASGSLRQRGHQTSSLTDFAGSTSSRHLRGSMRRPKSAPMSQISHMPERLRVVPKLPFVPVVGGGSFVENPDVHDILRFRGFA